MSMVRQIGLILFVLIALAIGGNIVVGGLTARDMLAKQWRSRNDDAANLIALALSQHRGDVGMMEVVLTAQFETGNYRRIKLVGQDGKTLFLREDTPAVSAAGSSPLLGEWANALRAPAGVGLVTDGWSQVGRVEVEGDAKWVQQALATAVARTALGLLLLGGIAAAVALGAVRHWRRGLDRVVGQAEALRDGRFEAIEVPRTPELARLATGMNAMVERVHQTFEQQSAQLQAAQTELQMDGLTGLANRRHFVALLAKALVDRDADERPADEPAPPRGALLMVRLKDMIGLNARVGRDVVDRLLAATGEILATYPNHVHGAFAGRLNGSDLALYLPVTGMAAETAETLRATLQASLGAIERGADVAIGAVEEVAAGEASRALARADEALAKAELAGRFSAEVLQAGSKAPLAVGEADWRQRLTEALNAEQVALAQYAVRHRDGALLHLECPLRVQLRPGAAFEEAARWMPMAYRSRLMPRVDLTAARLALKAIEKDQQARSVHVSDASIADGTFVDDMQRLLQQSGAAASRLSLECNEAALGSMSQWRRAATRWRAQGARVGIEHAGASLQRLMEARAAGLDYLKIDSRFIRGIAQDASLASYTSKLAATARSIGLAVYAEGVDDPQDLERLWSLGFDGATGPAVTPHRAVG